MTHSLENHPDAELLHAFGVGKLDRSTSDTIAEHLETCAECRRRVLEAPHDTFLKRLRDDQSESPSTGDEEDTGDFVGTPASVSQSLAADRPAPIPQVLGYEVLRVLGEGGMGTVYLARQTRLKRRVALKMILARRHISQPLLDRFKAEAEAAARLQHPHIVQVFEAGDSDGCPFIALEYIPGDNLAERIRDEPLPPRSAAKLVQSLALAIDHAHSQGVVHRDLKPANVLLQRTETGHVTKDEELNPKITDFGLARQMGEDSNRTHEGAVLGTPSFMAPEQASGQSQDAGPPADIYALGAILYACLTGRPPFRAATVLETLELVRTAEPIPPGRLQSGIPRDVETICLKCLQKSPRKRYLTARELAGDLGRFLANEPILARPIGRIERVSKWSRRHPGVALMSGVLATAIVASLVVVTTLWRMAVAAEKQSKSNEDRAGTESLRANKEAETANANYRWARANLYSARMTLAETSWRDLHAQPTIDLLKLWLPTEEYPEDLRGFEWHYLWRQTHSARVLRGHTDFLNCVAFSPDGKLVASGSRDQTIRLWDVHTGREARVLRGHQQEKRRVGSVNDLAFSPKGEKLASAGHEGTLRIWDTKTGDLLFTHRVKKDGFSSVAFLSDDRVAGAGQDGIIRIWNATTGDELLTIQGSGPIAVSDDGKKLAGVGVDKSIRIWDAGNGSELSSIQVGAYSTNDLEFGREDRLAWCGFDYKEQRSEVRVWDSAANLIRAFRELPRIPEEVSFHPDGERIAVATSRRNQPEGEVLVWNLATGREEIALRGHARGITNVSYSPDGKLLATGSGDQTVRIWNATDRQEARTLHIPGILGFYNVSFAPDGRLASGHLRQIVRIWNSQSGEELHSLAGPPGDKMGRLVTAFAPDGKSIAMGGYAGTLLVRDLPSGKERFSLPIHRRSIQHLAYHPDGRRLVVGFGSFPDRGEIFMVDVESRQVIGQPRNLRQHVGCVTVSPDGRYLAVGTGDLSAGEAIITDFESGAEVMTLTGHKAYVGGIAFDPKGCWIATGSYDNTVRIWDAQSGSLHFILTGHSSAVNAVAFSPDGRRLASASDDKTIRLWDPEIGQQTFTLRGHTYNVVDVQFSPDGHLLASAGSDGTVRVWDGTPVENTDE